MSRLKLPEFLNKRGMVVMISLLAAFSIIIAGTYAWVSLVQSATNEFEYEPDKSTLRILKEISDKDIHGDAYVVTEEDKDFPFEFTVIIGSSVPPLDPTSYDYTIVGIDGNEIDGYDHQSGAISQASSGTIKSGETVYLRDNEAAIIRGIPVGTDYTVTEKSYTGALEYSPEFDPDDPNSFDFGCDDPENEQKHLAFAKTKTPGWVSIGSTTAGMIAEDGSSEAGFVNIRVPVAYEIKISSLVVIDRIVQDLPDRWEAGDDIIDYSQPFPVEVIVGEDPDQSYYYEVVHLDRTNREQLEDHEDKENYYFHNDPHPTWHEEDTQQARLFSSLKAKLFHPNGLLSAVWNIAPFYSRTQGIKSPLHEPTEVERRLNDGGKAYGNKLEVSEGYVVRAELHHQSALIIYGIPTLTPYLAKQTQYENGIYTFHSEFNHYGFISPDLDDIQDPRYNDYISFAANTARNASAVIEHPNLWRTRADIFNAPRNGVKTIEVKKVWRGGSNHPEIMFDIIDIDQNKPVGPAITLSEDNDWRASVKVAQYDANGKEIDYDVQEQSVSGYTSSVNRNSTGDRFTITNTYKSGSSDGEEDEESSSRSSSSDKGEKGRLTVTKTVKSDGADRYKRFDFTVIIGRFKHKITLADSEQYTFTNIPVGTQYSVTEASYTREGYTTTSTGDRGTISAGGNTAAFVNTRAGASQSGDGSLIVRKTIAGEFVDTTKKFRFFAQIGQKKYTFYLRHGESKIFSDIPAGTAYTVTEDDYSSEDYVSSSKNAAGTVTATETTAVFVNEFTGDALPQPGDDAVQISGRKIWDHGTNTEYPQSIQVFVMNGSDIVTKKTVTAKENWKYAFQLPKYGADGKEIIYSINEEPVKKYIKSIDGYNLTNIYDPSQNPGTGGGRVMWIWFVVLAAGSLGLRMAVFYRNRRKKTI